MRILVLSQYYDPEPISKPGEVANELVARGHHVQVITGLPNYPTGSLAPGYRLVLRQWERGGDVRILRLFEWPYHGTSTIGRLANYGSFAFSALLACLSVSRPDVMYVWSPPLTVGVVASVVSALRGVPFVYDLQDIWPETLVFAGMSERSSAVSVMRFAERRVYGRASQILVPTEGARVNLETKGTPPSKIAVLPHWVNPDDFVELDAAGYATSRSALEATDLDFVVTYAGNLGFAQGLEQIVRAARNLRAYPRIKFRLIGDGAATDRIKGEIAAEALQNIRMLGRRTRTETARLLAASDLLLLVLRNRELGRLALPGKVTTYLASGRPILSAAGEGAGRLITSVGAGVVVEPDDDVGLSRAILEISNKPPRALTEVGDLGRDYARFEMSRSRLVDQLEVILGDAAKSPIRKKSDS
jgi:glycosyltransferase involved in cell wall biosynthesis